MAIPIATAATDGVFTIGTAVLRLAPPGGPSEAIVRRAKRCWPLDYETKVRPDLKTTSLGFCQNGAKRISEAESRSPGGSGFVPLEDCSIFGRASRQTSEGMPSRLTDASLASDNPGNLRQSNDVPWRLEKNGFCSIRFFELFGGTRQRGDLSRRAFSGASLGSEPASDVPGILGSFHRGGSRSARNEGSNSRTGLVVSRRVVRRWEWGTGTHGVDSLSPVEYQYWAISVGLAKGGPVHNIAIDGQTGGRIDARLGREGNIGTAVKRHPA